MPECAFLALCRLASPLARPGPEMQQRRGRRALHAEIAVGRPRHHALEQAEHAAHALDAIQRCDEVHLRGAGIGEADVDPARDQGPHQTFRTVHPVTPVRGSKHSWPDQSFFTPFVKGVRKGRGGFVRMVAIADWVAHNFNRAIRNPSRLLAKIALIWPACASSSNREEPDDPDFAALAVGLMLLASVSPARATMDDDFFNFRGRQRQQPQPQPGDAPIPITAPAPTIAAAAQARSRASGLARRSRCRRAASTSRPPSGGFI